MISANDTKRETSTSSQTPHIIINPSIPLLVEQMEAKVIEEPGKHEPKYAYVVTFKAIIPEGHLSYLVSNIEGHKVLAKISKISEETGQTL